MKIVEVVFDIPVDRTFDYLPGKFSQTIYKGVRVRAPFGRQKKVGIVVSLKDIEQAQRSDYQSILTVYDNIPLLNDELFTLAGFISERYFSSLGQALFAMIGGLPLKYPSPPEYYSEDKADFIFQNYSKKCLIFLKEKERKKAYIRIIQSVKDGSILLLFPEVSLAEEYYKEISNIFGGRVVLFHSELTKRKKIETWLKIIRGKGLVIIGTRIAGFSPAQDIKTIIIDRGNDSAYSEQQTPKYNACEVVEFRARFLKIPLFIGESAISIKEYLDIKKEGASSELFNKEGQPSVYTLFMSRKTVDKELSFFVTDTISMMEETLLRKGKVAIVHNRKGSSKILRCERCEYKFPCHIWNYPMTLSDDGKSLLCRFCKTVIPFDKICPSCGSKKIGEKIYGIEKIYRRLKEYYPDFRITKFTGGMEIPDDFDIVIGTSAVKKIISAYKFSLVVVINGESFLNIPNYNSEENFFVMLNEMKSMISNPDCKILIQTRSPNLEVYRALVENNPEIFYSRELSIRKQLHYPPFSEIIKIEIKGTKKDVFEHKKRLIENYIKEKGYELFFSGPSFPPVKKGKGVWKYLLRFNDGFDRQDIKKLVYEVEATVEVNPAQI
ncbi:MAG: primosomal protein N' [Candidatus Omnitrophica bacterium]|nr:primosomal protein N' [Candidatus Omnitrophota bacterium]